MSNGPAPPDVLPKYLSKGIPKQNDETLREIQSWIDELLEYRNRPLEEDEVVDSGEQIEDVEQSSKGSVVVKKVPCGKDKCSTCPHGPYKYLYYREGDKVKSDYLGRQNKQLSVVSVSESTFRW